MNFLRSLSIGILISIVIVQQVKSWNIIADIDIIEDQISRYRRSPKLFVPRCQLNQYFDKEEKQCLSVAGGGNLVYIDKRRSCGMNILKPDCSNDKYYYICKGNRTILAECVESQHFENRLQRCVYDEVMKSNETFSQSENAESSSNHIETPACVTSGRFPVPGHCTLFYTCETNGLRMFQNIFKCPKNMGYDSEKEICTFFSTCGDLSPEAFSQICLRRVDDDSQSVEELTEENEKSENLESTVHEITLVDNEEHSRLRNEKTCNAKVINNVGEFTSPLAPIIAEDIPHQSVDFPDNSAIEASSETHFSEKSRISNTEDSSTVESYSTRNASEEHTTLSENLSSIGKIELAESSSTESSENLSLAEEINHYGASSEKTDDNVEEAGEEVLAAIEETTHVNSETADYTSETSPVNLAGSTVESANNLEESSVYEATIGSLATSDSNDLISTEPNTSEVAMATNDSDNIESTVSTEENDLLTQTENTDVTENIVEQSTMESSDVVNSESVSAGSAVSNDNDVENDSVDVTENVSEVSFTEDKVSDETEETIKDSVSVSTIQSVEEGVSDDSASLIATTSAYYANYDTTISPNEAEEASENSEAETSFSSVTEPSVAYTESASDDSSVFTTSSVIDRIPDLFTMIPSIIQTLSPSAVPLAESETVSSESESVIAEPETVTSESESVISESETVTSESESVTSEPKSVISESETVTSEPETVTSESESVTSESETMTSELETVTSGSESVTSESETVTSESESVASEPKSVISESETVTSESESVTSEPKSVISESETVTSEPETVTSESESVTSESETMTSELETVTSGSESVTSESETVTSESESVASEPKSVISESETVTSDSESVTSEPKSVISESETVTSESESVTSGSETVTSESEAVTSELETVTSGSESVTSESETVTSESESVASEPKSVISESETVTSESESVTSEPKSVISESETVTSESESVTSGSETVTSESESVTSESETVTSESEAVTSEPKSVISESETVTSKSESVTSEPKSVISESETVTSKSESVTSKSKSVISKSETVTYETKSVTSESEATVSESSNNGAIAENVAAPLETSSNSAEAITVSNDQLSSVQNKENNAELVTEVHYTFPEYTVKVNEPQSDNVRITETVNPVEVTVTEAEESGRLVSDHVIPILTVPSTIIEGEESTENSYTNGKVFTSTSSELYSANDDEESETILVPSTLESHSVASKTNDKLVSSVADELLEVTTKHKDITKNYLTLSKKIEPQNSQLFPRPLKSRVAKIANKFEKRLRNIFGRATNRKLRQEDE